MAVQDSTQRFSSRVENYVRYRPGYPSAVIDLLKNECGLSSASTVADIASGTGIFSRTLLENGNRVFGVEPNAGMRRAGEEFLRAYPRFISVAGTAEATTLDDHSVDFVTAAQAAHWFDREKARREFVRICRPGGWTVLLWNERRTGSTPFLRAYEQLLVQYGTDYQEVRSERTTQQIETFFAPSRFQLPYVLNISRGSIIPPSKGDCCPRPTRRNLVKPRMRLCCANCGEYSIRIRRMVTSGSNTTRGYITDSWFEPPAKTASTTKDTKVHEGRAHAWPEDVSHDPRGIPAARTRCRGLDRRLLRTH